MASRRFPFPTPFGWFQVAFPDDLAPGEVTPLHYWNRELVLWRDAAGDFHLQDAFCPHLGAHLALRRHRREQRARSARSTVGDYDGAGACTNIPYSQRTNRKAQAAHLPDDRAQRLRARVVPPATTSRPQWEIPVHRGDRRPGVERLLLVVVRDPHRAAGDVGERRRPRALPVRARHRERRRDGELRHRRAVLDDAVEAVVRHAARRDARAASTCTTTAPDSRRCGSAASSTRSTSRPPRRSTTRPRRCGSTSSCASSTTRSSRRPVADAFVKEINKQVQEDQPIWEHKAFLPTPALADTDGPIMKFRKWYSQFYAEPYEVNA